MILAVILATMMLAVALVLRSGLSSDDKTFTGFLAVVFSIAFTISWMVYDYSMTKLKLEAQARQVTK